MYLQICELSPAAAIQFINQSEVNIGSRVHVSLGLYFLFFRHGVVFLGRCTSRAIVGAGVRDWHGSGRLVEHGQVRRPLIPTDPLRNHSAIVLIVLHSNIRPNSIL